MLAKTFLLCSLAMSLCAQTNVLTQHNDIGRTGQNTTEAILTPANVTTSGFGKLMTLTVDGQVYAQPLYMSSVTIAGVSHRVVFVATEHNSVFAFDVSTGVQLWKASMLDSAHGAAVGATPDPRTDTGCHDIDALAGAAEYGITGTPVIDAATGTLYVVSVTYEGTYPVERLHALDVTTGNEKLGGPAVISASVPGTGNGSSGGVMTFDPKWENQRSGLLEVNGNIYIAFASHCDYSSWHGWILGYNATTLAQTAKFITTPNGSASGIWMGGGGLAADVQNNVARLFPVTGNGSYDTNSDYGDDILRLVPSGSGFTVADSFTPSNQAALSAADQDLASGGALLLPDQPGANPHLLVQLGKTSPMYLVNRDNMGGYNTSSNKVVQQVSTSDGLWGLPAYWNSNIYLWHQNGALSRYPLTNGALSASPSETSSQTVGGFGLTPSVSSNGTSNGIVWAVDFTHSPQVVYAYNASNVSQLLWSSAQNATRDSAGSQQKFAVPTISDGKVFVGSNNELLVYGLLGTVVPDFSISTFPPVLSVVPGSSVSTQIAVSSINGFSGSLTLTASGLPAGVTASFSSTSASSATLTLTAAAGTPLISTPVAATITATSGSLVHSLSLSIGVASVPVPTAVDLKSAYNVYGIFTNGTTVTNGGFDADGYAYSANLLGTSVAASGVPFYFATPNLANALANTVVPLPPGSFTALNFVGAGVNGNQASQVFTVSYIDGTATTFTQSLSDWFTPQNYAGETVASSMAYRVTPTGGTDSRTFDLYAYSFALNTAKTVKSLTLPANRNVTVLAVSLLPTTTTTLHSQSITFGAIASHPVGTPLTLSATASSGLAVAFATSTPAVCSVAGTALTLQSAGTCSITASQAGNATYASAPPVSQSFTVTATAGSISISASTASVTVTPPFFFFGGTSATDRISVTPSGGFTGAVTFTVTGLPTGVGASFNPTSVTSSGATTLTLTPSSAAARNRTATLTVKATSATGITASTSISLNY